MRALRVEDPTTLTRVSEYIPEIVQFTAGIIDRGLGYEEGGSVYFNTTKFEGSEGSNGPDGWKHTYAKLQPWSKGNRELLEDGEGNLVPRIMGVATVLILIDLQDRCPLLSLKDQLPISLYGNHLNLESHPGHRHGDSEDQDGTSNVV